MPIFSLPLADSVLSTTATRKNSISNTPRKRKRTRASSDSSSNDEPQRSSDSHNKLLAASTNPLSLAPDEIAQYRLAGLSLDEVLPQQKGNIDWPHRAVPAKQNFFETDKKVTSWDRRAEENFRDNGGKSEPVTEQSKPEPSHQGHGHRLRMQHLNVLTAIVHRCLLEGDIPRAMRAYSLLIRAEAGGKALDIKSTGYWGIGAELLARSSEQRKSTKFRYVSNTEPDFDSDADDVVSMAEGSERNKPGNQWASKEGLQMAKSYYETLILQYPYKKFFHEYVSALDFWPAMAACEIYGIQQEQQNALRRVSLDQPDNSSDESSDNDEDDEENIYVDAQTQLSLTALESPSQSSIRQQARRRRRLDNRWTQNDEIRCTALSATTSLADRMDYVMNAPPFDKDVAMLRLRGMIELYVGDLSVPALPAKFDEGDEDTARKLKWRLQNANHDRGKVTRQAHWEKAQLLFDKYEREGGEGADFDFQEEQHNDSEQVEPKVGQYYEDIY